MHITILGAGAWGTALAAHAAQRHTVTLWARNPELAAAINAHHHNPYYLPSITLPESIRADASLAQALSVAASLVVIATPLAGLAQLCQEMHRLNKIPEQLLWLCKGVEPETFSLPHQVVIRELGEHFNAAGRAWGTLSGPSFAQEVASGLPCALVAATQDSNLQATCQSAFHHHHMRIYASQDVIGVELGGAIKNVLAIAAGISDGLNLGLNARAALLTRGLAEMTRLGLALGAKVETFSGLAGIGDLILTATGNLSRNRTVGLQLAQGNPLPKILQQLGHVAEGVYCAQAVQGLAQRYQIEMPICSAVAHALESPGKIDLGHVVTNLLAREPKAETLS